MARSESKPPWHPTASGQAEGQDITLTPYMHWWLDRQTPEHQPLSVRSAPCIAAICPTGEDGEARPIKEVVPLPDFAWNPVEQPYVPPKDVAAKTDKPPKDAVIMAAQPDHCGLATRRSVWRAGWQRPARPALWPRAVGWMKTPSTAPLA